MRFSKLGDLPCLRSDNAPTIPSDPRIYYSPAMSYRLRKKSLARQAHRVAREELEGTLKELLGCRRAISTAACS